MVFTIALMSLGTLMIGIAPTYETAGYWGTATLVLARLIQGVAAGGEVGGPMSLLLNQLRQIVAVFTAAKVTGDSRPGQQLLWWCCRFRFKCMAALCDRFRNRHG